jgi:hypothetical protein
MNNHIVTKSRAVGISHYRIEEILPVNVLSRYSSKVEYLYPDEEVTAIQLEIQRITKEIEELLFAEYDGMPNTPERRAALGSSVEEHLYNKLKGGR